MGTVGVGPILAGLQQGVDEVAESSVVIARHTVQEKPLHYYATNPRTRLMFERTKMVQIHEAIESHSLLGHRVSARAHGLIRAGAKALVWAEVGLSALDTLRALAEDGPTAALEVAADRVMDTGFAAGFGAGGAALVSGLACAACTVAVVVAFAVLGNNLSDRLQAMTDGQLPNKVIGTKETP